MINFKNDYFFTRLGFAIREFVQHILYIINSYLKSLKYSWKIKKLTYVCPECGGSKKCYNSYDIRDCDLCMARGYLLHRHRSFYLYYTFIQIFKSYKVLK